MTGSEFKLIKMEKIMLILSFSVLAKSQILTVLPTTQLNYTVLKQPSQNVMIGHLHYMDDLCNMNNGIVYKYHALDQVEYC